MSPGRTESGGHPDYDFETLDIGWLMSKHGRKWHHVSPRLAAWVADMDFRPAPSILEHLAAMIDGGDLGYPERHTPAGGSRTVPVFCERMAGLYGWHIEPDHVREWNDVVQSIQAVLHAATRPGDRIVVHTPGYPPFFDSIDQAGCTMLAVPARIEKGTVLFDHDALDRELTLGGPNTARVIILCNPHNPTGHVFRRAELERIVDIAVRHDLLIISDEIHSDIVFPGARHIPIATVPGAAERTVTLNSASKSFNLAGLRYSVSHCSVPWVNERMSSLPDHIYGATNIMGAEAAHAAWTVGGDWFSAVLAHLARMRKLTLELVAEHLPGVGVHRPDATYLAWLDCSETPIADDPLAAFRGAGVEVSPGTSFGPGGEGHVRLNFATSSTVLRRIIGSMGAALSR